MLAEVTPRARPGGTPAGQGRSHTRRSDGPGRLAGGLELEFRPRASREAGPARAWSPSETGLAPGTRQVMHTWPLSQETRAGGWTTWPEGQRCPGLWRIRGLSRVGLVWKGSWQSRCGGTGLAGMGCQEHHLPPQGPWDSPGLPGAEQAGTSQYSHFTFSLLALMKHQGFLSPSGFLREKF